MARQVLFAVVLGCLLVKVYANLAEEARHQKSFVKNILRIDKHNKWAAKNKMTFEIDVNQLADKLPEQNEDATQFDILMRHQQSAISFHSSINTSLLPDHVDWREKSVATRVKDEGRFCRSSYAFSAIGAVESLYARSKGSRVELSEQNIVDCTVGPKGCYDMVPPPKICNRGCRDGQHLSVFEYIMEKKGVDSESSYPYTGEDQKCKFNASAIGGTLQNYYFLGEHPDDYEKELQAAVANKSPVTVAFDARFPFDFYKKGVYNGCPAEPKKPHFSRFGLVVGYGTDEKLGDYWIVKNSYGPDWGEAGYIRMARNKNNNCGISTFGTFVV